MVYRFLYGKKCIITAAGVLNKPDPGSMDYTFPVENDLADALMLGKQPKVNDILGRIFCQIRTLSYTGAMISLFHLTETIRHTLSEITRSDSGLRAAAIGTIGRNLLEQETLDAFREDLLAKLEAFFAVDPVHNVNRKHEMVVETVTKIVLNNFSDVDMDLTSLSGMMKMSSKQLSKIFRENTGLSLPDYISAVRMQKAAELLETTDLSIGKIAARTGILNETYFFTMFKKHFGTSPSAYKTSKALDRARPNSIK
jgi:AraC-like DNA-binding protein